MVLMSRPGFERFGRASVSRAPYGTLFTSEPPALDRTGVFSAEIRYVGWRRGRLRALKILASKLTASRSSAVVLTSRRPSRWPCT